MGKGVEHTIAHNTAGLRDRTKPSGERAGHGWGITSQN